MKKAIITGATGLVGLAVARYFSSLSISVLCLGRQTFSAADASTHFGGSATYLQLAMEDIQSLDKQLNAIGWSPGDDCVFFNFAWGGDTRLTDGGFAVQLNNAIHAAQAVRSAKGIGCVKFVNAGTLEETYVEQYLTGKSTATYQSSQTDYALAKLASRDMCKMVAYMEKIDYVHTRLSVPLAPDLSQGSYVAQTLKKIFDGTSYTPPENKRRFDIIFTDDVARAYQMVGTDGKNKADYFIGSSRPATLANYFAYFAQQVRGTAKGKLETYDEDGVRLFSTELLHRDTGFIATTQFEDLIRRLKTP